jgi:hypothetical protein
MRGAGRVGRGTATAYTEWHGVTGKSECSAGVHTFMKDGFGWCECQEAPYREAAVVSEPERCARVGEACDCVGQMRQSLHVPDHCTDDSWLKTNGMLLLHTAWRDSDGRTACTDDLQWACGDSIIPAWCECRKRDDAAAYSTTQLRDEVKDLTAALAFVLIMGPLGVFGILLCAYVLKLTMHVSIQRVDPDANIVDVEHAEEIERKIIIECPGAETWTYEENGFSFHLRVEGKKLHVDAGSSASSPRDEQGFAFDTVLRKFDFRWDEPFEIQEDLCKLEYGILMIILKRRKKRGRRSAVGAEPPRILPAEQHTIFSDVGSEGTHALTEDSFEHVSDNASVVEQFGQKSANPAA